ncbi:hypothetical protein [Haloferula sp. A504]|uniref:hypothetical protein n=1 Tax=Haloferula sp. A504 TaxID=3373601 RepID=UPI0031C6CEC9|nr:GldG family protein [Verrucomicrobiaceae bacterium E54]
MSDPESKTVHPPSRRPGTGFLSVLQVVFVICLFLAVNFLGSRHSRPIDLSDNLGFTLAGSTRRYLESDAVRNREQAIDLIVAFRADSPFYDRIRPLAEEYARLSGGKIRLRLVDPIRANDVAESLSAEYGLVFSQDMVIIDARAPEERSSTGDQGRSPHVHVAKIEDMLVFETDANQQRKVRAFLGEDAMRAGLVEAIEGRRRKMWVLADKSDLTSTENEGLWTVFASNLLSQNILPERVPFAGVERVPDDIEAIAVIDAAYDFTSEEIQVLEDYWSRPRAAILVTVGTHDPPRRLRAFLREHGVTPRSEHVVSEIDGLVRTSVTAGFTEGMEFTRDLWEKTTGFEGVTRALEVREGAEDLLNRRIQPFTLVEADPRFWGETDFPAESVEFNPEEDLAAPVPLAAAVLRGNATDDRTAGRVSRMIVLGNSAFMRPDNVRKANLDLLASCSNWLVGREALAGESARNIPRYRLPLLEPQITYINRLNLVILPALLLLIGASVWSARRA